MKISIDKLFTAGQTAKLQRISKDALFFYEKKGLIRPAKVEENGYRYYSTSNFLQLDLIAVLKACGCSLEEIKHYLDDRNADTYISTLEDKLHHLQEEQKRLQLLKKKLQRSLQLTQEAVQAQPGQLQIIERPQQFLIRKSLLPEQKQQKVVSGWYTFCSLVEECQAYGFLPDFHISAMIEKQHLLDEDYTPDYYYTNTPKQINSPDLFIRPAGRYISYIHQGPYRILPDKYQTIILPWIRQKKLQIIGNAYEETLLGWFNANDERNYITNVCIQIA